MDHTKLWLAEERARELRHQAATTRRARSGRPGAVRSLVRQIRGTR